MFAAGGCYMSHHGESLVKCANGTRPLLMHAPWDGEYELWAKEEDGPRSTYSLHEGDLLGFKPVAAKSKEVIAVAGKEEIKLPDGEYFWKKK
jgi:hypothetical protein